jgi:O-antigen/teichoic acid export membrane protein
MSDVKKSLGGLSKNAIANVSQSLITLIIVFFLYRYINMHLGVASLGVWSVVLSSLSAVRLFDIGFSGGITKFVAKYYANRDLIRVKEIIDTVSIIMVVILTICLPIVYPLFILLLEVIFDSQNLLDALQILPYAMVSLWFGALSAVLHSGLDGIERMDLRAYIVLSGQLLLLILAVYLIPFYGLLGLAYAQLAQGVFLLVVSKIVLVACFKSFKFWSLSFNWTALKGMFSYGLNIFFSSVLQLMFEPFAKGLMAYFGGASSAGYFEVAYQVAHRARSLIVTANYAVVPRVSAMLEQSVSSIAPLYKNNLRLVSAVIPICIAMLAVFSNSLSLLLVGSVEPDFLVMFYCLSIGWGINALSGPAHYFSMGDGSVKRITLTWLIIACVNLIFGLSLGYIFGGIGVAVACTLSLIIGASFMILMYQKDNAFGRYAYSRHDGIIHVACLLVIIYTVAYPVTPVNGLSIKFLLGNFLPFLILALCAWIHPFRKAIENEIKSKIIAN